MGYKDLNEWAQQNPDVQLTETNILEASYPVPKRKSSASQLQEQSSTCILPAVTVAPDRPSLSGDLYYFPKTKSFIHPTKDGGFTEVNEYGAKRFLKAHGAKESGLDSLLFDAQYERSVSHVGPLAGYNAGMHCVNGKRALVDSSPIWIPGKKGDFDTVRRVLISLLELITPEQMMRFLYWLGFARQSITQQIHSPGQALVLAGPRGSGKSFTQKYIITPPLGGRSGDPYPYLSGQTGFNSELLGCEHLAISDPTTHKDYRSRREFGERIKGIVANENQRCEAKYGIPLQLMPYWRLSVSLNNEPENLQVLPPVEESLADKLMIFLVNKARMPMPTRSLQEKQDFAGALLSELPALAYWIDELTPTIPEDYQCPDGRYGVGHYHNPALSHELQSMTPEEQLKDLLCQILTENWEGGATELHAKLCSDTAMGFQARGLLRSVQVLSTYLSRLSGRYPAAIRKAPRSHGGKRSWEIDISALSNGDTGDTW
jgi:hypothetical protein